MRSPHPLQHTDETIHLDCEGGVQPFQDGCAVLSIPTAHSHRDAFLCLASRPEKKKRRNTSMMDQDKIREGVRLLLEGIGEDVNREGLLETPDRIARMCEQIFGGLYEDPGAHLAKQFQAVNNNMVLEKDILFYSVCEHHLLPFYGKAHVAYIPDGRVAGLSKLARTVEVFARRPQIQENMTAQIADALEQHLHPKGVMVMLEAEHMCMTMRGVQKPGSKTVTTIVRGVFAEDLSLQQTFLQMVK
ncbi:MAG TPA: GTP cyclohydrolase I FolE [Candidatus Avoscillospira avistercoris]|uniref:GTP cyclohydrolase 1 n=1 Tax=Candidatus Avoscillospira avistercoris TaxID=2840707 RepID=A0A9D1F9A1_9FIRM|nr:GTP cyclohydrolase I FolE [Candidatus Avoscillospira avistercoris]